MKITIKQEQRPTRLGLPGKSNLRDKGAKTIRLLMILCCTAWLASCNDDDSLLSEEPQTGQQIKFEMGFAGESENKLKVYTEPDNYTSSWEDGDKIGVYIVKGGGALQASGNYADNVEFTYNEKKWTTATPQYYPNDGDNLSFYAYYPYDAGMTDPNVYTFNVPTDQDSNFGENYMKNDFLWAKQENIVKSDNAVTLQFSHALAMIEISIFINETFQNPSPKVNLLDAVTDCSINLSNQSITPGSTKNTIQMRVCLITNKVDSYTISYCALVPPQTMDMRFVWTKNNIPYTVTPATNVTLTSGNMKKYKVNQP